MKKIKSLPRTSLKTKTAYNPAKTPAIMIPKKPINQKSFFKENNNFSYTSADDVMTANCLKSYLKDLKILSAKIEDFEGQKIEEIRK